MGALPEKLNEIRDEFLELEPSDRLLLLLDYSRKLPELPERLRDHPDLLEKVVECQSPVYLFIELDSQHKVHLHATAPQEAPTTRGFASILSNGIDGLEPKEVLDIPDDFPQTLGLTQAVSPLRIRGMSSMLARSKRQLSERLVQ